MGADPAERLVDGGRVDLDACTLGLFERLAVAPHADRQSSWAGS
jgi:hypothetical protein